MKVKKISFEDYISDIFSVASSAIDAEELSSFLNRLSENDVIIFNTILETAYYCPYKPVEPEEYRGLLQ